MRPHTMNHITRHLWIPLFTLAIVGFALTAHREAWAVCRWVFLALAGVGLCGGWVVIEQSARTVFGETRSRYSVAIVVALAGLGVFAAMSYRRLLGESSLPTSFHWFALVAMGVGLTEELLWRGWIQGALSSPLGWFGATLAAAASHTAYKVAMFAVPSAGEAPLSADGLWFMVACTFGVGVVLGLSRVVQGTIAPAVAFHVLFDLLVYGARATAPWWVW